MSFSDKEYREIITKAVCGKGVSFRRQPILSRHHIDHQASWVLGN